MFALRKKIKDPADTLVLGGSIVITLVALFSISPFATPLNNLAQNLLSGSGTVNALTASPEPLQPLTRGQLIHGINQERAKVGVEPLTLDARLNGGAQAKAKDMEDRGYYDHPDPDGKQGYSYAQAAVPGCSSYSENLAANTTAEGIIADWMGSEAHRNAMLDPKYDLTGLGIYEHKQGEDHYWYVVEHFCELPGDVPVAQALANASYSVRIPVRSYSTYVPTSPTTYSTPTIKSTPSPVYTPPSNPISLETAISNCARFSGTSAYSQCLGAYGY